MFVDSARVVKARHFGFLAQPICVWSICLTKCSIAWTALRTRRDREWQWVFCWVIFVQTTCTIAANVIQVVQCQPTSALWTDDVAAQCWPPERTQLAAYVTLGKKVIISTPGSLTDLTRFRCLDEFASISHTSHLCQRRESSFTRVDRVRYLGRHRPFHNHVLCCQHGVPARLSHNSGSAQRHGSSNYLVAD